MITRCICLIALLSISACMPKYAAFDPYRAERVAGEPLYILPLSLDPIEEFEAEDGTWVQSIALYIDRNLSKPNPITWGSLPDSVTISKVTLYDPWRGSKTNNPDPANEVFFVGNVEGESFELSLRSPVAANPGEFDPWSKWVVTSGRPTIVNGREALSIAARQDGTLRSEGAFLQQLGIPSPSQELDQMAFLLSPRRWRLIQPRRVGQDVVNGGSTVTSPFRSGDRQGAADWQAAFLTGLDSVAPQRAPIRLVCMRRAGTGKCFEPGSRYRIRVHQRVSESLPYGAVPPADVIFVVEKRDIWGSVAIGIGSLAGLVGIMTY